MDISPIPAAGATFDDANPSDAPCPWFLRDETWALLHSNDEPGCVTSIDLKPYILAVQDMLGCWVRNGHNGFIHRRLYEHGMPRCVQDAFTTLAAYVGGTSAVKEIVLQIAEEHSGELILGSTSMTDGMQSLLAHLARVQALFVYEFIRLFDGSVRLRTSAAQQLPTLRHWAIEMWEAAKRYRPDNGFPGSWRCNGTANGFDIEYEASLAMWQSWILTESVRRTHLVVDTVSSTYQSMAEGWAECNGAVMFTARRGLWEAESAAQWTQMCRAKPPLLVPSLRPQLLISQYAPGEVDDFATTIWTYIIGEDRIRFWHDRSKISSRT